MSAIQIQSVTTLAVALIISTRQVLRASSLEFVAMRDMGIMLKSAPDKSCVLDPEPAWLMKN
jgi:hypothetical protein